MILETQDVVKRFGGLVAVDHVSMGVDKGEILGVIGPNGAGKTTLLNVIAGRYQPTSGIVRLAGESIGGLTPERICRKGLARTFQISHPFPQMSALENVMVAVVFGRADRAAKDAVKTAAQWLEFVEFPMPAHTLAKQLNTGQLKRLDLARALASNPKVLMLDEVGAGLTPPELEEVMALLRRIANSGIATIVVEHLMRLIMGLCDRIIVLHYGQKIAEGTPHEIRGSKGVAEAYLGEKYLL